MAGWWLSNLYCKRGEETRCRHVAYTPVEEHLWDHRLTVSPKNGTTLFNSNTRIPPLIVAVITKYWCLTKHCFDNESCDTGLMAPVNEWVMVRSMMNLIFTRWEEGKSGAGQKTSPAKKHQGTTAILKIIFGLLHVHIYIHNIKHISCIHNTADCCLTVGFVENRINYCVYYYLNP
jgi:hypothetical protein